jgi:large subunit ribosomal protein L23
MIQERYYDILRYPRVTEKGTSMIGQNKYVFTVAPDATKQQIKKAVQDIFGAEVEKVNIINVKPKVKKFKGIKGKRSGFKKALITLSKANSKLEELVTGA